MPTAYKVLAQSAPSANTDTNIYTCPASTQTVISSIVVTNRSSSTVYFRIAVRAAGAALANQHYIVFDAALPGNDSSYITAGITLNATDVVTVRASSADLSFSLFGSEIS